MADLPRPTVDVTSRETDVGSVVDVVISRDGKAKSYTGTAAPTNRDGAFKDAVEKVLNDGTTAEWLPRK